MMGMLSMVLLLISGCAAGPSEQEKELKISAASSMRDAMKEIGELFEKETDFELVFNFGSSGTLAQQIHQGAPVDVYISANRRWMEDVEQDSLMKAPSIQTFATTRLVLASSKAQQVEAEFSRLDILDKVSIGDPESVPAGAYAKEALIESGQWHKLEKKLVYAKNVRQVAAYIASGNVDAGIIYASDAVVLDDLNVIETIPETLHSPVEYVSGITASSKKDAAAKAFLEFLKKEKPKKILADYGFEVR
ncbi:molybdate ABC transporter substrate-binding protein [Thalassobacillus hwangdonensis]|uniref:Molybdate ABC transporter substrate-binding protein n=1 Tax=Thalassobacillus hwangdonensis TaxID=546108 RepID=A0ABW3KV37_9BACI